MTADATPNPETGLIDAFLLDGAGGGRPLDWAGIDAWTPERGVLWVHLQRDAADTRAWLQDRSGLDSLVVDALLAEETRPRAEALGQGMLLLLRGVNLNPGADPEDMVSIRVWADAARVVTVRIRKLVAVRDMVDAIGAGRGPGDSGDLVVELATRLLERMEPVIEDLGDSTDELEETAIEGVRAEQRRRLVAVRHQTILLRRYLTPQRDALRRLTTVSPPWFDARQMAMLREAADRVTRYVEDLDAVRERAAVIHDEMAGRQADQLNQRMYVLSVVAAIMLPLGVVAGLLGINVGGIPGADSHWGFAVVLGILVLIVALQIVLFRRMKWM